MSGGTYTLSSNVPQKFHAGTSTLPEFGETSEHYHEGNQTVPGHLRWITPNKMFSNRAQIRQLLILPFNAFSSLRDW